MAIKVKICGLNSPEAVRAAATADYGGFVFYERSPRYVTPARAASLAGELPKPVQRAALLVDVDDAFLRAMLQEFRPDLLQLHGRETPERVAAIRQAFGIPVMKVISVRQAEDVARATAYATVADRLLFDAKPPERAGALPGGNATSFDWTLLAGQTFALPVMLGGGLTRENLSEAVRISGVAAVDVSSGVEDAPGRKNPIKIKDFIKAARAL